MGECMMSLVICVGVPLVFQNDTGRIPIRDGQNRSDVSFAP
jgi:hypothetical protein